MTKALKVAIVALGLTLGLFGCDNTTHVDQTEDNAGRFHSEAGYVYVVTDTETDVQYLAWNHAKGGGICVLVDADGKPMLAGDAK